MIFVVQRVTAVVAYRVVLESELDNSRFDKAFQQWFVSPRIVSRASKLYKPNNGKALTYEAEAHEKFNLSRFR